MREKASVAARMADVKLTLQDAVLLTGIPMKEWLLWKETRMLLGIPAGELRAITRNHLVEYSALMSWLARNRGDLMDYLPSSTLSALG